MLKKAIWTFIISLILAIIPLKMLAQAMTTGTPITQPTPQIIHPVAGSTLTGTVLIEIYIPATVILEMDVFALNPQSQRLFLGVANQVQGNYYDYYWKTNTFPNNSYQLWAEAQIYVGPGNITTYSDKVSVTVANQTTNPPTKPTPLPTPIITATPAPTPTPQATEEGTATTQEGEVTQKQGAPIAAKSPQTSVPTTEAPKTFEAPKDLVTGSKVSTTISFKIFQDKTTRLEKIEGRISSDNQKFLLFSGKAAANAQVTITVNSQPLVMTAKADSAGNWTYTLEKPLEPGKHEVYVEVTSGTVTEKTGPYPFNIAKAQAGPDNPFGASLDLVDPRVAAVKNYLYAVIGAVGLAILIALIIYLRRSKKLFTGNSPKNTQEG